MHCSHSLQPPGSSAARHLAAPRVWLTSSPGAPLHLPPAALLLPAAAAATPTRQRPPPPRQLRLQSVVGYCCAQKHCGAGTFNDAATACLSQPEHCVQCLAQEALVCGEVCTCATHVRLQQLRFLTDALRCGCVPGQRKRRHDVCTDSTACGAAAAADVHAAKPRTPHLRCAAGSARTAGGRRPHARQRLDAPVKTARASTVTRCVMQLVCSVRRLF